MDHSIIDAFLSEAFGVVFVAGLSWCLGRWLHVVIGRGSEARRRHGQFIPEWVAATVLSCGLGALCVGGPVRGVPVPPSLGFASMGVLLGLALGSIHGLFRIKSTATESADEFSHVSRSVDDDDNPFRPPRR